MAKVRLEIDEVSIHRPKKNWRLYFLVYTDHPQDSEKMIIATVPTEPFKLSRKRDNTFTFDSDEEGSEGLFVLSRDIPENREINVQIYLRHTRSSMRNLGDILKNIETEIGNDTFGIITDIVGTSTVPWLVVSKKVIGFIGSIISKIPDRDFGFVSASEKFGPEFQDLYEIDRKKDFSGDASLVYSWSIDE